MSAAPMSQPRTMLDYARAYAARGWSVVPARNGTKWPAGEWLRFQQAPAPDARLVDWFAEQGFPRLGMVTGSVSNCVVADFDGEQGMETLARLEARGFPASIRQLSPSGGCHVLLRHPGVYVKTRQWRDAPWTATLPGMDIRGDGGFLMLAPSSGKEFGHYQWDVDHHPDDTEADPVPSWFLAIITAEMDGQAARGPGPAVNVERGAGPLGLDLGTITDGRETYMRNTILAVCRDLRDRLGRLPTAQELEAEAWPQYSARVDFSRPGRGLTEFRAKVAYTLARAERGAVRGLEGKGDPFAADAPSGGTDSEKPAGPDVFPTYGIGDIIAMPPPVWLVEGIITTDGVGGFYGPPASLKSFLALGMSLCLSYGRPWMGREVQQVAVLYTAAEGVRGMGRRIRAWQHKHGLAGVDAPFRLLAASVNLTEPEQAAKLIRTAMAAAEAEGCRIGLVVIDTVARAMAGADENSAQDMGRFIAGLDAIKAEVGCAVLGIHHSGKDATRGARGSSAFLGAMDMLARVERSELGDTVTLTVEKQKEDEEGDPITLAVEKVDLGGGLKPESSLVLVPSTAPAKGEAEKAAHLALLAECAKALGPNGKLTINRLAEAVGRTSGPARTAIRDAIPLAPDCAELPTETGMVRLWRVRQGEGATSPIEVRRHDL